MTQKCSKRLKDVKLVYGYSLYTLMTGNWIHLFYSVPVIQEKKILWISRFWGQSEVPKLLLIIFTVCMLPSPFGSFYILYNFSTLWTCISKLLSFRYYSNLYIPNIVRFKKWNIHLSAVENMNIYIYIYIYIKDIYLHRHKINIYIIHINKAIKVCKILW